MIVFYYFYQVQSGVLERSDVRYRHVRVVCPRGKHDWSGAETEMRI